MKGLYMALTTHDSVSTEAQTALTVLAVPCGLLLLPFVAPPARWWEGGVRLSGDWRPTALAGALFLAFAILLAIQPLRSFFGLVPLDLTTYLAIAGMVAVWALVLRFSWRARLLDRFLGVDLEPPRPE
jgi:cation-transporting ATPase E